MRLVRALAVALLLAPSPSLAKQTVRVAAASSLEPALAALARAFEASHPGVEVLPTFGATGTFFAQIANGAPFDVLLAADMETPRRISAEKLGAGEVVWAHGSLVLWIGEPARALPWADGLGSLGDPAIRRIAIANPKTAPYGRAAVEVLGRAGLAGAVERKLVVAESALQAVQFARLGAVDAAFVPRSLAGASALPSGEVLALGKGAARGAIEYGAVVLAGAREPGLARSLLAFILGPQGREILAAAGLDP